MVVTLLAVGWSLLGGTGGSGDEHALDLSSVEQRFLAATRDLPEMTASVQEYNDLDVFDHALTVRTKFIEDSVAEFGTIAKEDDGAESKVARHAVTTGKRVLLAIERFRIAIIATNDLTEAQEALDDIAAEVDDLEAEVRAWKASQ